MLPDLALYEEKRPWGHFRRFTENSPSTVKIISIKPNETLSLQSHSSRSEFWRVISGSGKAEVDGVPRALKVGDEQEAPVGTKHRLSAGKDGMEILEIAFGDFSEDDIIRYEDAYGRV